MQIFRFIVFVTVFLGMIALGHRYLWARLVRDTELPKPVRKGATLFLVSMALLFAYRFFLARRLGGQPTAVAYLVYVWLGFLAVSVPLLLLFDVPAAFFWLKRWLFSRRLAKPLRPGNSEAPETTTASEGGAAKEQNTTAQADQATPAEADVPEALPATPAKDGAREDSGLADVPALVPLPSAKSPSDRRLFLRRAAAGVTSLSAAGLVGVGMRNALGDVEVNRLSVKLPRLPRALDGFGIVQLSDVHIGALLDGRFLDRVVETVNGERPDAVVITGDLVDGSPKQLGAAVARLGKIKSRYGVYFVTGNHEYYSGATRWLHFLDKLGIQCLQNARVRVGDRHRGGASFDLAGVCDESAGRFVPSHRQNLAAALRGRDKERELVLLAHRPNIIEHAAEQGVSLQLSGHTHGGQFFPITLISPLVHPYNQGLYQHKDAQIYVSPGTGFWGPPMRTMTASEVTSLRLIAG
jgi:uncharacterized protein